MRKNPAKPNKLLEKSSFSKLLNIHICCVTVFQVAMIGDPSFCTFPLSGQPPLP
jgi:hypothetical protein